MSVAYPGELARRRCAKRTRAELVSYQPRRPLALRDALRINGMHARCGLCRACPKVLLTLAAMHPPKTDETASTGARVLRLAS